MMKFHAKRETPQVANSNAACSVELYYSGYSATKITPRPLVFYLRGADCFLVVVSFSSIGRLFLRVLRLCRGEDFCFLFWRHVADDDLTFRSDFDLQIDRDFSVQAQR